MDKKGSNSQNWNDKVSLMCVCVCVYQVFLSFFFTQLVAPWNDKHGENKNVTKKHFLMFLVSEKKRNKRLIIWQNKTNKHRKNVCFVVSIFCRFCFIFFLMKNVCLCLCFVLIVWLYESKYAKFEQKSKHWNNWDIQTLWDYLHITLMQNTPTEKLNIFGVFFLFLFWVCMSVRFFLLSCFWLTKKM